MQRVTNFQELETIVDQNGKMIVMRNNKNNVVVMSIEEYKNKLLEKEIERKLQKAEEQIESGKTVKATEVFKELEEIYGF